MNHLGKYTESLKNLVPTWIFFLNTTFLHTFSSILSIQPNDFLILDLRIEGASVYRVINSLLIVTFILDFRDNFVLCTQFNIWLKLENSRLQKILRSRANP